jgi:hypothetical protein
MRFILLALVCASTLFAQDEDCKRQLMDTTYQQAIDRTNRIPDAQEWAWYGVAMTAKNQETLLKWTQICLKGGPYEIQLLFSSHNAEIGNTSFQHYKHPDYVRLLRWTLDETVQNHGHFELPDNDQVERAYLNFIEYKEQRAAIGFDEHTDDRSICRAAADAAGYFFWRGAPKYVGVFDEILEDHDCPNDLTMFEEGKPLKITQYARRTGRLNK